MKWLLPFNLAWLVWLIVRTGQGVALYEGQHAHLYAWLFMTGLATWIIGSLILKWVWAGKKKTNSAYTGFGLWIAGFVLLGLSLMLGANMPTVHILRQHVLFGHLNYLEFLVGLILSAYLDFRIIAGYAPFMPILIWRSEFAERVND